jgi:predicted nuclease with RNAse H fold
MKKPIFRVFVSYSIKKNSSKLDRVFKSGVIDTFVLTSNKKEIERDEELLDRICYINKVTRDKVSILIEGIDIEAQYGETIDRF